MRQIEVIGDEDRGPGKRRVIVGQKAEPGPGLESRVAALEADVAQFKQQIKQLLKPPAK